MGYSSRFVSFKFVINIYFYLYLVLSLFYNHFCSYIAFCSNISSFIPTDIFLMDKHFKYDKMAFQGLDRVLRLHDHVNIENSSRRIEIKGDTRNLKEFLESIEK